MRVASFLGIALVLSGLVACAPDAAATPIREAHPSTLAGTSWRLVAVGRTSVPAGPDVTLEFGDGEMRGTGPCNGFGGPYQYRSETGEIAFGAIVSTKRACVDQGRGQLENALFAAIRSAALASMDETGRLVLTGAGEALTFEVGGQPV
jgi:heat shock protein HslJ